MGFARRVVRKSVRKVTPRPVRKVMHPVGSIKSAVTPRPIRQVSRAMYTVTNPLGAAENALIGAALYGGRSRSGSGSRTRAAKSGDVDTQWVTGTGIRAAEGVASFDQLTELMASQRAKFAPSRRPEIPDPVLGDPAGLIEAEWKRRKTETRIWHRALRRQLRSEIEAQVVADLERRYQLDFVNTADARARAEAWWQALNRGDKDVMRPWLAAAFSDNPAKVMIYKAEGVSGFFFLHLPGVDVLPAKKPHVTPTGRLSSKAWTKTELNDVYAELLGAHLLATLRETWAVAPSLEQVRVVGLRQNNGHYDVLFDVGSVRGMNPWHDDNFGSTLLAEPTSGLVRAGRIQEVRPWSPDRIDPDVLRLLP